MVVVVLICFVNLGQFSSQWPESQKQIVLLSTGCSGLIGHPYLLSNIHHVSLAGVVCSVDAVIVSYLGSAVEHIIWADKICPLPAPLLTQQHCRSSTTFTKHSSVFVLALRLICARLSVSVFALKVSCLSMAELRHAKAGYCKPDAQRWRRLL